MPLSDVKMTPRDDGMKPRVRLPSFPRQRLCMYVGFTCANVFKDIATSLTGDFVQAEAREISAVREDLT